VFSGDQLVRAPLGLLWFGGPANDEILPRHGHGPTPQVIDGRLFIEGRHLLRCMDIYTGRVLWERRLEDLGRFYDNTSHQPGANEIGSNYVAVSDGVYVVRGRECLRLDPATGRTVSTISLPSLEGEAPLRWGFLAVWEDLLVATAAPIQVPAQGSKTSEATSAPAVASLGDVPGVSLDPTYASTSRTLLVLDRVSGEVLWRREAQQGFRHNTIVIGDGKVFCIDRMSDPQLAYLRRRGYEPEGEGRIYALDARSGKVIWSRGDGVSGTWLGYSSELKVLLEGGSSSRDRAADEARRGIAVLRGEDGSVVWEDPEFRHTGPCILVHDTFFTNGAGGGQAYELLTGQPRMKPDPLTGEPIQWKFFRNYGCNTAIGSEHMLLFRSAAAGFFDLAGAGGTGNMGGFKSGCTSNLIPAGGILSAPDYTRTCTCSYQNQTSLAMIHRPDADAWTFSRSRWSGKRIRRVGINLGAPGDRVAPDGTLWLDAPSVGGPSPKVTVKCEPESVQYFRHHSSLMSGPLGWVAGSGVVGVRKITIALAKGEDAEQEQSYRVRLVFSEPLKRPSSRRVFDVALQGRTVLRRFDLMQEAGGSKHSVIQDFSGIRVEGDLTVELRSRSGETVLCGVEVHADGD
jgi:putative pyrroloquinoline-quinone binding quinoprotein/malectin (di-glucose binding ER protein)